MWLTLIAMMVTFSEDKLLDVESARALVQTKLKQLGIASAPVQHLENGEFKSVLAGAQVFLLRYPRFPVARIPPAPLSSNNLFFVSPSGAVDIVSDAGQLRGWFQKHVHADSEKAAAQAVRAWLILAGELRQDGFYQFRLVSESVRVAKTAQGLLANARLEVVPKAGNEGFLAAELLFDPKGRLIQVREDVQLKPGIRPICQATKLLDPDPIVRRMAERDLLILGRLAKPYLDEQRQQADPALRRAIDQLWQRIEQEER